MPTFLLESTTSPLPATVRSEEKRFVDDAVVENKFVVVAFVVVEKEEVKLGNIELVEVVAVKYEPRILFPRISPATESLCPGVVVPMPTLPELCTRNAVL